MYFVCVCVWGSIDYMLVIYFWSIIKQSRGASPCQVVHPDICSVSTSQVEVQMANFSPGRSCPTSDADVWTVKKNHNLSFSHMLQGARVELHHILVYF